MNVGGGLGKEVVGGMACGWRGRWQEEWKEFEWLMGLALLVCVMVEERMDVVFFGMGQGQGEWVCVVEGVVWIWNGWFWEVKGEGWL